MTEGDPSAQFAKADLGGLRERVRSGKQRPDFDVIVQILLADPAVQGMLSYDEFSGRYVTARVPPFGGKIGTEWTDEDDLELRLWLAQEWGLRPKVQDLFQASLLAAHRHEYHEVRDYLRGLKWDGTPRVRDWLPAYMGAPLSPYSQAVGTKWLVAAVARVMQPGCKADHVLILEGEQGSGKSTALKILGGDWFTDAPFRLGDREGWMVIRGCWIVELGELDSFNRAESTSAKLFFSQYQDRYRSPWGKRPTNVPRQCVFAGTTNQAIYLKDESGNRRYWPVRCGYVDPQELQADRDQLWAEAVELYRKGVPWHVTADERDLFLAEAEARLVPDAYETKIVRFLDADPQVPYYTMADILEKALNLEAGRWTRVEQTRVGQVMSRLDWPRLRAQVNHTRDWYYVRPVRTGPKADDPVDIQATSQRLQRALNTTG